VRALILQVVAAFAIAAIAVFFGMFLPFPTDGAVHNPIWELIFGIGFWIAELFPHAIDARGDALIGFLLWPALMFVAVWFSAFLTLRAAGRKRLVLSLLFIVSLLVCVGRDVHNSLAVHVPLWSNGYFVRY
jgi:hypothetical protein